MAVICSNGLIGKAVVIAALGKKSPVMVVTSIEEEAKDVEVTWLDNNNAVNIAVFPSKSLDKFESPSR
jgi:hypothetical protein